jgi:hypothetical protein
MLCYSKVTFFLQGFIKVKVSRSLFVLFVLIISSQEAKAIKATATASVEIVEPMGISQSKAFETLHINKVNNEKGYSRKIPEVEYSISGSKNDSIQINVASANKNGSKVKIGNFILNYSAKTGNSNNGVIKSVPGKNAKLKIAATLKVASGAKSGLYKPDFDIVVYYE